MRPAYIYRDPRDALLSAYENGKRAREKGRENAFSHLVDFETALQFMQEYVYISEAWVGCMQALHTRYETLLEEYDAEAGQLAGFLELDIQQPEIRQALDKYRPEGAQPDQKGLHFSKGKVGRFRYKLSEEQQAILARAFGPYLEKMGYAT